eukprot:3196218-Pleurochrysis_carterae.AAC.1
MKRRKSTAALLKKVAITPTTYLMYSWSLATSSMQSFSKNTCTGGAQQRAAKEHGQFAKADGENCKERQEVEGGEISSSRHNHFTGARHFI